VPILKTLLAIRSEAMQVLPDQLLQAE